MNAEERGAGIVLLCDSRGIVLETQYDGLGIAPQIMPGRPLHQVVDEASIEKARNFLNRLQTRQAAFDWELNVPIEGQVATLCFTGVSQGEHLLIVAARTNGGAAQLFEEFVLINNEQANALRAAFKDHAEMARGAVEREGGLYDEISRLNNDLVAMQRELYQKNADLERLNALKNQFLGMAAHDLRNPLAIIQTYSEFMLDEAAGQLGPEQLRFLQTIHSSSEFMARLINDLLDVSAIEAGRLQLDRQPTDLVALLERNVALQRVLAEKKQIQLVFDSQGELPAMLLDGPKIEQVLSNLISNAVKFSHPGSTVEVRLAAAAGQAIVAVQDHGQGIPPGELGGLFKPFARTSVKSTAGEKSTGLGLVIARRIVEGHQGKIWVESQVGQGSTFFVSLPLQ